MLRGKTKNENRNWKVETKSLFRFSPSKIVFFFFKVRVYFFQAQSSNIISSPRITGF